MTVSAPGLARKLGVKEGDTVALVGSPPGWGIDGLPDGVRVRRRGPVTDAQIVVAFFRYRSQLAHLVAELGEAVFSSGALWVAWPRRASGHHSDITDEAVREVSLPVGLVDVKVAALDSDWSGLKLVWRRHLRSSTVS